MSNLVLYSIPAFVALVVLEALWARKHPEVAGYELRDTATSLSLGLMNVGIAALAKLLTLPAFFFLYEHRLVDLGALGAWSWVILILAEDCCYYWFHRTHHQIRILWAAHVNHHSSQRYNLSTALRQPLLTPFTGPVFWMPLALLGFPPHMILTAQALSLLYQFWLHTEAIGTLGMFEEVLNTPSHHRVHHGSNPQYLDRNHGGILIIWDRLFGTFAREDARVVYGLTTNITTHHPLRVGFHEVAAIGRDVASTPRWRDRLRHVFGPPGWKPSDRSR